MLLTIIALTQRGKAQYLEIGIEIQMLKILPTRVNIRY